MCWLRNSNFLRSVYKTAEAALVRLGLGQELDDAFSETICLFLVDHPRKIRLQAMPDDQKAKFLTKIIINKAKANVIKKQRINTIPLPPNVAIPVNPPMSVSEDFQGLFSDFDDEERTICILLGWNYQQNQIARMFGWSTRKVCHAVQTIRARITANLETNL